MFKRHNRRAYNELRKIEIEQSFLNHPFGSVLYKQGNTVILASAIPQNFVPPFLEGTGQGWITAEYGMLPASAQSRIPRERNKVSGRTYEIQRIIGRSLRAGFDLNKIGQRTIIVDCDVMQADGGTRTASITAGFIALYKTIEKLVKMQEIDAFPLKNFISGISVGKIDKDIYLDLDYREDSAAEVDLNLVMNEEFSIIEIQGTAEGKPFSTDILNRMVEMGRSGIQQLIGIQRKYLSYEVV